MTMPMSFSTSARDYFLVTASPAEPAVFDNDSTDEPAGESAFIDLGPTTAAAHSPIYWRPANALTGVSPYSAG
jgi:hypothetical protein